MGHHHFDPMPRTPLYKRVVALLGDSAGMPGAADVAPGTLAQVVDATVTASVLGLRKAKGDDAVAHCFYLLAALARAGRDDVEAEHLAEDFPGLFGRGADGRTAVGGDYTVYDLVSDFSFTADRYATRYRARTDLGEMAQFAAAETLSALCGPQSTTLFGSTPTTMREALARFSTQKGFAMLAHDFFSRFSRRFLEYHLSRELSNHVGARRRFAGAGEHNEFLRQLGDHCRLTTGVIRQFAAQWFAKHLRLDDLSSRTAQGFVAHAIDKIESAFWYVEETHGTL